MDDPAPLCADELAAELAIAAGLRAGHADAWARLHDDYAPRVWRTVARLLGGCEAAVADVVQETFLAAAKSARGFDPARGPLWAWLWGIARTQALLHLRRRARHAREKLPYPRGWDDPAGEPLDELLLRESADLVRLTLLELPEEYGRILSAKYLLDSTIEEIAAAERLSVVAARSKLARAREAFRASFRRHEPREAAHDPRR